MVDFTGMFGAEAGVRKKRPSDNAKKQVAEAATKAALVINSIANVADMAEGLIEQSGVELKEMHVDFDRLPGRFPSIFTTEMEDIRMELTLLRGTDTEGNIYDISFIISGIEEDEGGFQNRLEVTITRVCNGRIDILVSDENGFPHWEPRL